MKITKIELVEEVSPIVITTWQSAYDQPVAWFKPFGIVIGDEAHTFKAKCLSGLMEKASSAFFRIGTTGTVGSSETVLISLEASFGGTFQVSTTKDLIENDTLAQLFIKCIILQYGKEDYEFVGKGGLSYPQEVDYILKHSHRQEFITKMVLGLQGNSLVLFNFVGKHGKPMFEAIRKAAGTRKVFYISGETAVDAREAIRHIVETEKDAIIVASFGTFQLGINIVNLHNVVFTSPTKSEYRLLQSIGRGLRKTADDKPTTVIDIIDDLSMKKKTKQNFCLRHGIERVKIYAREGLKFKIIEVPFSS